MQVLNSKEIKGRIGPTIAGSIGLQFSKLVFQVVSDRRFPQHRSESQISFLANSLGANGKVKPRRSREICRKERSKPQYKIVRKEFYIECTCGYSGPARDGACRECGTGEVSEQLQLREEQYGV
jgi:hypothetical protein